MKIEESKLTEDHRVIIAWMKEHETILAKRDENTIYVLINDNNLLEIQADIQSMTEDELGEQILEALDKLNSILINE